MHAQGLKRYRNSAAVAGSDFTVSDQCADLARYITWIGQDRAKRGPCQQAAIGAISPVGKRFGTEGMVYRLGCLLHRRSRATDQPEGRIEGADGRNDRGRERAVGLRLVVQGPVRFDVVKPGALGAGDRVQRP